MLTNHNIFHVELKLATNIRLLSAIVPDPLHDERGKKPLPDSSDGGLSLLMQED